MTVPHNLRTLGPQEISVLIDGQEKLIRERAVRGLPRDERSEANLRRVKAELERAN